jgi:hypothetical protein
VPPALPRNRKVERPLFHRAEPTITCPNCKTEIKLTESLAAPLIEATRRQYEARLAKKDADMAEKEESLREREEELAKPMETLGEQGDRNRTRQAARTPFDEQDKIDASVSTSSYRLRGSCKSR